MFGSVCVRASVCTKWCHSMWKWFECENIVRARGTCVTECANRKPILQMQRLIHKMCSLEWIYNKLSTFFTTIHRIASIFSIEMNSNLFQKSNRLSENKQKERSTFHSWNFQIYNTWKHFQDTSSFTSRIIRYFVRYGLLFVQPLWFCVLKTFPHFQFQMSIYTTLRRIEDTCFEVCVFSFVLPFSRNASTKHLNFHGYVSQTFVYAWMCWGPIWIFFVNRRVF